MDQPPAERPARARNASRAAEVLAVSVRLGLTSFGGPIAHLGYFERAFVRQRQWLSPQHYGNLVALCQMLPGPTSSQVNFLIGLQRAGWPGALAAWLGFTLPSALLLYAGARLSARVQGPLALAVVHGLKLVALAVVAQAVWVMARRSCTDGVTALLATGAAVLLLLTGGTGTQLAVLVAAAVAGALLCREAGASSSAATAPTLRVCAWLALALFALLLAALLLLSWRLPHSGFALAAIFYRAGALVFGGGHVVLPLLRAALVPDGWLSDDTFLTGYGLAQAVPGPLFSVAAYLGAVTAAQAPAAAATVAVVCIFLPGMLLAVAGLSLWSRFERHGHVRAAMLGINAAVVGILAAALYNPIWTTAVRDGADVAVAAGALVLLSLRAAPLFAVLLCVACSVLRSLL